MKKSIFLPLSFQKKNIRYRFLLALSLFTSFSVSSQQAMALDILTIPACISDKVSGKEVLPEDSWCFMFSKDFFSYKLEFWMFLAAPFGFLAEDSNPMTIPYEQLLEMGYSSDEVSIFQKDINFLSQKAQRQNLQFTSVSEAKAWLSSQPLAPITRELLRTY